MKKKAPTIKRPPVKKKAVAPAKKAPAKAVPKAGKGSVVTYRAIFQMRADFYNEIAATLRKARSKAYRAIDSLMVEAYWDVGRQIVEEEQLGNERAAYGAHLLRNLALRLTDDFGPGYDERELRRMRQFYRCFPIRGAVRPELDMCYKTGAYAEIPVHQNLFPTHRSI